MNATPANLHATAVVLDQAGILILGESGSGKTTLALHLVQFWQMAGRFACLVSDDQVLPEAVRGRLLVSAPSSIRGLVEVWGKGPAPAHSLPEAVIDLAVMLDEHAPRFQDLVYMEISDIRISAISVRPRNADSARRAIKVALDELQSA